MHEPIGDRSHLRKLQWSVEHVIKLKWTTISYSTSLFPPCYDSTEWMCLLTGSRCLGVRQQEPCSGETAAATLDAHMLGQLRPAPKLNSVPSFSSSASTLDQLLSLSPLSTEAHSALFQRPNDYVHKTSYPPLGHNWLSATGAGVSYGTASTSSAQQQPAATQAWQTCDASFPQEMDDLLDWAASEGMQDGVPMGVSNASDQALDLHLQSSMPEVPCYSFEDLAVDIPSDASNNVPPELCDMYAALEQHCALSNCHTQTGSDVLPTLDNLAQQDMMSALTQKQTPTTSDQQMPKTLHTDIYCLDSTAQTTAPVPLQQISEADPNILRASSTASYGLQLLFAATADQTHDQVLDCLQFPEEPSWLQLDECHQQQAAHSNGLQLGCTASSTQMQEGCTASSYPLHLGYTAASAHLHEADYNSNSVSGTPLQTGCPASSSPCLQTDHNTCQQADYNSGTGSGSGDCNAGCERPGGDVALAEEAAVRKRKGGRPRVYDLDRPIPSGM